MAETRTLADLKGLTQSAGIGTEAAPEPAEPEIDRLGRSYATGRRKNAIARVWVKPGTGKVTVNGKALETYFARPTLQMILREPFGVVNKANHRRRGRPLGAGGRGPPRHQSRADPLRSGAASGPEGRRLHDA